MDNHNPTKRRLCIISEVYYPEESPTGHYLTYIAEALALTRRVSVICAFPNYTKKGIQASRIESRNGVSIYRCWSTLLNKNSIVLRIINVAFLSVSMFLAMLIRVRRGDLVLVGTNPPTLPFFAVLACYLRRAQCMMKAEDIYPDNLIAAGLLSESGMAARFLLLAQRSLLRRLHGVFVLGRDMEQIMKQRAAPCALPVACVPNWADSDSICPEARSDNKILGQLGLTENFVIGYAGNMGPLQGIDFLFACMMHLRGHEDVHFLFIGAGKRHDWLVKRVRADGLSNVTILGHMPRSEQSVFLNACDLGLVSLIPGMLGVGVPSRTYNYLAAGKPILAAVDNRSEIALLVEEEQIGWVVPPGSVDKFAQAVFEAKASPSRLAEFGKRARGLAETKYSRGAILQQYQRLLETWNE